MTTYEPDPADPGRCRHCGKPGASSDPAGVIQTLPGRFAFHRNGRGTQ